MASVNKVIILGRLGRDPEPRQAQGTAICNLAVATSRRYKDRDGNRQEETEWHRVVAFGRTAEVAQQYLQKGSEVYIEGRLRTRQWEQDGQKRYATEIIAESLQLGARSKADGEQNERPSANASEYARASGRAAPAHAAETEDDIPF